MREKYNCNVPRLSNIAPHFDKPILIGSPWCPLGFVLRLLNPIWGNRRIMNVQVRDKYSQFENPTRNQIKWTSSYRFGIKKIKSLPCLIETIRSFCAVSIHWGWLSTRLNCSSLPATSFLLDWILPLFPTHVKNFPSWVLKATLPSWNSMRYCPLSVSFSSKDPSEFRYRESLVRSAYFPFLNSRVIKASAPTEYPQRLEFRLTPDAHIACVRCVTDSLGDESQVEVSTIQPCL